MNVPICNTKNDCFILMKQPPTKYTM